MKKAIVMFAFISTLPFVALAKPVVPAPVNNFNIPYHGMLCRASAFIPGAIGACIMPA